MIFLRGGSSTGLPTGLSFLEVPDQWDESNTTYFYFGWEDVDGGWLVHRQARVTGVTERATQAINPGQADFTAAWTLRTSLVYA